MTHIDLDPREIDPSLYTNIYFVVLYQYQYVVGKLNYETIRTCDRKGLYISMRDYKGTTTGVEITSGFEK